MKKILSILLLLTTVAVFAEVEMGIGLSNETIDGENYQSIALQPELDFGFVGIGIDLDLRFMLTVDGDEPTFEIYEGDWILDDGDWQDYLSLYLNKFSYLRLGHKNEDFYLNAGSLNDTTLGNGTIIDGYTNTLYEPETSIFGVLLDIDGELFNFPYIGFESFLSDVARVDFFGGRLYARPFSALEIPVISNIEFAGTGVIDRDPYIFSDTESVSDDTVLIYGADITIPFIDTPIFTLDISGDLVIQDETNAQIYGLSGKLISLIDYKLEYLSYGDDYIDDYFNSAYDLNRTSDNFEIYHNGGGVEAGQDINASAGFEIMKAIYFEAELGGLMTLNDSVPDATLSGTLSIDEDILQIFSAEFSYYKTGIDTLDSIVDPVDAIIGGGLYYYSGNMVVSFLVDVAYNSDAETTDDQWITNTALSVNFQL